MRVFFKAGPVVIALFACFGYFCYPAYPSALNPQGKARSHVLSAGETAKAKQLFKERCAKCHGTDGRGETAMGDMLDAPNFTDKTWWDNDVEDKRLIESIRNGKAGMPKFGKKLTGQQIILLVNYLRRFEKSAR
jgi:cytochrome c oxidase cbb3-type subunit III